MFIFYLINNMNIVVMITVRNVLNKTLDVYAKLYESQRRLIKS